MCAVHSLVYFSERLPLVLEAEVEVSASFTRVSEAHLHPER